MGGEVIIALFAVVVAIGAVIIAMIVITRNNRKHKKEPTIRIEARLMKLYSQTKMVNKNYSSSTVDQAGGYEVTSYFAEFRPKYQPKISFNMKKKEWLTMHEGDQGILAYKGNQLISFTPYKLVFEDEEEAYFKYDEQNGDSVVNLYGEATSLSISIPSDHQIEVNLKGLSRMINDLKSDHSDWFFILSKSKTDFMQIEKEHKDKLKITYSEETKNQIISKDELFDFVKRYVENQ